MAILQQLEERMLSLENLLVLQTEIQNAWTSHSQENAKARRVLEKQLRAIQIKIRNITTAISNHGHSRALLNQLNALEQTEADARAELGKLESTAEPTHYTRLQLTELAEQLKHELHDENKTRDTIRGLVARVIARRTDDQITGVMYCNQVNGQVPPWGSEAKTLFELVIPIRKYKTPLYPK
jgi:hypothetical protein